MSAASPLLLAFYADDFTGATDALEQLDRAGVRAVLFLRIPEPADLARYPGVRAVGVAGRTRALDAGALEAELQRAFAALGALGPRHLHYKVCSTFDSAPETGSIGRAIEVGADVCGTRTVPVVAGTPALGRYCVFGHLFAQAGIGGGREVHRLDRHPTMSRHPVTPADESDLRRHLGRQTTRPISLFDVRHYELDGAELAERWREHVNTHAGAVVLDALTAGHVAAVGRLLDGPAANAGSCFCVGSSAVEQALATAWAEAGRTVPRTSWPEPRRAEPLLVVSGSCSPVTAGQIAWARSAGFAEVPLAPREAGPDAVERATRRTIGELAAGRNVVVHSLAQGPQALPAGAGAALGEALGGIADACLAATGISRLLIAGGDTSGAVARRLGIEALEVIAPLTPGAPLCRVRAPGRAIDGVEVVVKGGQVGPEDHFGRVAGGIS